ncbi:leukocyte elastase inhibitor-like [Cheilinus undulatus]|uniref:leukocyte elastase inhibitor-like n=1 Tax=Cheilinus undulatus TaxID=241271 RepID=UPI001BD678CD|nr:leukocyte elastase inhibitor-like [Cheilinus undulatus]XP_041670455.1 leukocyte elastase inhibitor-like [Cheilinus undulatus]
MLHFIALLFLLDTMASTTSSSSPPLSLAKANSTFSLDLLKQLSDEDKKANIFCSPFSITSALAMVMLGTRGSTAAQISEVLGFTEGDQPKEEGEPPKEEGEQPKEEGDQPKEEGDQPKEEGDQPMEQEQTQMRVQMRYPTRCQMQMQQRMKMQLQQASRLPPYLRQCLKPQTGDDGVHAKLGQLLKDLNKENAAYAISLANRLYGEQTYHFKNDYLLKTKKHYSAELECVDFKAKAEEARATINRWVDDKTKGKIKELLQEGVVDGSTVLVLVNAIYFKGKWAQKFNESDTAEEQFRITKNEAKAVKMMRQKSKFSFRAIPEAKIKVLEMPYEGGDISMIILLPDDIMDDSTGLETLEKTLTHQNFVDWTRPDMMNMEEVTVKLPRFNLEESYNLNEVLKKMGMVDVFDVSKSDFSGMSLANNLVLSKVIHKANVEVTEEGTEATAATGAVVAERAAELSSEFFADHPFLFFIKHIPSKTILFSGRFCNPE